MLLTWDGPKGNDTWGMFSKKQLDWSLCQRCSALFDQYQHLRIAQFYVHLGL